MDIKKLLQLRSSGSGIIGGMYNQNELDRADERMAMERYWLDKKGGAYEDEEDEESLIMEQFGSGMIGGLVPRGMPYHQTMRDRCDESYGEDHRGGFFGALLGPIIQGATWLGKKILGKGYDYTYDPKGEKIMLSLNRLSKQELITVLRRVYESVVPPKERQTKALFRAQNKLLSREDILKSLLELSKIASAREKEREKAMAKKLQLAAKRLAKKKAPKKAKKAPKRAKKAVTVAEASGLFDF